MPIPGGHKTVQARVLEYAEAIGWTVLFREKAEERRAGFGWPQRACRSPDQNTDSTYPEWALRCLKWVIWHRPEDPGW